MKASFKKDAYSKVILSYDGADGKRIKREFSASSTVGPVCEYRNGKWIHVYEKLSNTGQSADRLFTNIKNLLSVIRLEYEAMLKDIPSTTKETS